MKQRAVSILLALVMAVSLLPVQVMGAVEGINYSQLSCDTYVEDEGKRNYINQAMQKYLEKYEELRKTLEEGNAIIFFFEGGSDYAKTKMELADGDSRYNAEVLVVKKENGTAQVVYGNGCCSTVPDNPALYGYFSSGSGPETICDGIYQTVTKTKQTSTTSKALHLVPVSNDRAVYLNKNNEKGYLRGSFGSKIDIHRSYYSVPHTELAEAGSKSNSLGCLTVAKNTDRSSYEAFIKVVTGYDNAWREGYSTEGNTVGYTVVNRQLFKTQLTSLYDGNEAAIDALTVHSEDLVIPIEPEPSPTYADIPTVTSAYASEQAVTVNWSAAANAVSYDVYLEQGGSVRYSQTGCSGLSVTFYGVEYGTYNAYVIANPTKDRNQISNTFAVEVVDPDKVVVGSGYCGGEGDGTNLTWTLTADGTLTISGTGKMADYAHYSTGDTPGWYDYNKFGNTIRIRKITIGRDVTNVGNYAFAGCIFAEEIIVPEGVEHIGDCAFGACTALMSITIPDSVTSIGNGAFSECEGLTNIILPTTLTYFGNAVFLNCHRLEEVNISNSVMSIGDHMFYCCNSLVTVRIPNSVKSIGMQAFYGCTGLALVTIPSSVIDIVTGAFDECSNLSIYVSEENPCYSSIDGSLYDKAKTKLYRPRETQNGAFEIPNGVEIITESAFSGHTSLNSVSIPNSVKCIENSAFYGCKSLASVILPHGLTSIGYEVFRGCEGLREIKIPATVESVGLRAFYNCKSLEEVYFVGTQEQWEAITIDYRNEPLTSATIHFNSAPTGDSAVTAGATVKVTTADGGTQEVSAVDGTYSFASLPAGTYTICVEKTGYVSYKTEFVYTGVNRPPDVTLVKRGDINGAPSDTGDVDAADMQCLFELLATGAYSGSIKDEAYRNAVADVNSDGIVDILDYQALYMHITA